MLRKPLNATELRHALVDFACGTDEEMIAEINAMSEEEIDVELREAGIDPQKVEERAKALAVRVMRSTDAEKANEKTE